MYTTILLKIGSIAGMYYTRVKKSDNLIIYGIGAPIPPDNGMLPDARIIEKFDCDIFVPDYIGFGRSDGIFMPKNCINTFLKLYSGFIKGCIGINSYANKKISLKYKRVIFIGRSFGGTYIPLLPRFDSSISELAIFCPVVDSKSCGSVPGEETNADFLRSMQKDGYNHLYRGILNKVWKNHLENKDDLSPMDNIATLKNSKLFIGHGKRDKCVHYSKSVVYYNKIINTFLDRKACFKLKLYPNNGHDSGMTNKAVKDFLLWIGILPFGRH